MYYSQNDERWQHQRLGTCDGITIGDAGCFVTAFANMANDCTKQITPAQLDDIFTNQEMYVDGCLCTDDMLTRVYPDIVYQGYEAYQDAADLSQLNNDVKVKQIVEIDANLSQPGLQTHFMYFYDCYNGVVRVIDSWTGQLINVAEVYGDPATVIYKIVTYRYEAAGAPTIPVVDPAPEPAPPHAEPAPESTPIPVTVVKPAQTVPETPQPTPASTPPQTGTSPESTISNTPKNNPLQVPVNPTNDITPGVKTSEFKITGLIALLPIVLPIVNHYFTTAFSLDQATQALTSFTEIISVVGAAWAAVHYNKGRVALKLKQ